MVCQTARLRHARLFHLAELASARCPEKAATKTSDVFKVYKINFDSLWESVFWFISCIIKYNFVFQLFFKLQFYGFKENKEPNLQVTDLFSLKELDQLDIIWLFFNLVMVFSELHCSRTTRLFPLSVVFVLKILKFANLTEFTESKVGTGMNSQKLQSSEFAYRFQKISKYWPNSIKISHSCSFVSNHLKASMILVNIFWKIVFLS